jgi:hypothetical protein
LSRNPTPKNNDDADAHDRVTAVSHCQTGHSCSAFANTGSSGGGRRGGGDGRLAAGKPLGRLDAGTRGSAGGSDGADAGEAETLGAVASARASTRSAREAPIDPVETIGQPGGRPSSSLGGRPQPAAPGTRLMTRPASAPRTTPIAQAFE